MVHALHEAHRVLKPNGLLLDLRPGTRHRRVGLLRGGRWREVGAMRERFDDDRAANKVVAQAVAEGLFRREGQTQLDLKRYLGTPKDLRAFMDELVNPAGLPPHDWLVQREEGALNASRGRAKIVVRGPLRLRVMRKGG